MDDDYLSLTNEELEALLFTQINIEHMMQFQKTIELLGIITQSEYKPNVMKALMVNRAGTTIQLLIWDREVIEEMKKVLKPGNIVHLDGVSAKTRNSMYSSSMVVPYDLVIGTNTVARVAKKALEFNPQTNPGRSVSATLSPLEEVLKFQGMIVSFTELRGWLSNPIREIVIPNSKLNQGVIVDCVKYKLEIRMPPFGIPLEYTAGAHVSITGVIQQSSHPYLWVAHREDIKLLSDATKSRVELMRSDTIPHKRGRDTDEVDFSE